ncbi:MAG TPA: FHA domain-containing protein [bacterium]|nr:FHA domain-containing protein [bacterium]
MGKYSSLAKSSSSEIDKIRFSFIKGKYSGGEFSVRDGQKLSIGRDISSDVAIVDSKVSRHHAVITCKKGKVFIEDSNSTNGTFINEERINPETPFELSEGMEISIGDSTIIMGNAKEGKGVENNGETGPSSQSKPTQNVAAHPFEEDDDEEPLTLDAPLINGKSSSDPSKVNLAKVSLKKGGPVTTAKTVPDSSLASTKGSLSAIDPVDLLQLLSNSSSTGYLILKITSPFKEKIEIAIGTDGMVSAESSTNKKFSQEKVLSRFLLARDGDYEFKVDPTPKREKNNELLEDIFMEIANQRGVLQRYRKIVNADLLRFLIPMTGKLADLSKPELESLQFMVNTKEVLPYLDMFPDNDDFILLSEILKYIDLGILDGDNNEEPDMKSEVPEDLVEI